MCALLFARDPHTASPFLEAPGLFVFSVCLSFKFCFNFIVWGAASLPELTLI